MEVEVVTVGTELLLGFTVDTNTSDIALALAGIGAQVVRHTTVGDAESAIQNAVSEALDRTQLVIVTGGLGPTRDDITKRAVANVYHVPLYTDEEYLGLLERRFEKVGRAPMPESNRCQAEVPAGGEILPNRRGTAPGLWLEGDRGITIMLPGVPRETRGLIDEEVIPRLMRMRTENDRRVTLSHTLRTTGVSESELADRLAGLEELLHPVTVAFLPGPAGVDLRLTAWQMSGSRARQALDRAVEQTKPLLGRHLYGDGDVDLAAAVLELLRAGGMGLAVAESCTGGELGSRITAIPGCSDVFLGGVVCYSDRSKMRDLAVPTGLLDTYGAVSEQVAEAMLNGVCHRFDVEAGIAITGVAGPGGGSEEKPVGTVCIAARVGSRSRVLTRWLPGGRRQVRQRAAQAALDLARSLVSQD